MDTTTKNTIGANNINFIKSNLRYYALNGLVSSKSIQTNKAFPNNNTIKGIRFSVPFRLDKVYAVHYDIYYVCQANNLFNVFLEGKVSEMCTDENGKLKWKRDIKDSKFSGSLGIMSIQSLAQTLQKYIINLVS